VKTSILVAAILTCALSASVVSAQEPSPPARPAMRMDMDKHMAQMQENMKKMQLQMEKLRATTDPTERQRLMLEHMRTMQENMKAMRAMGGPMMKGEGERAGTMKPHEMMERRMDMMQLMMEQMMQHDQAMEAMPAK
jgi:hypothetical protein